MTNVQQLYAEIPDMTGKVALITGGNTGVGKITCQYLVAKGAKVYMGARNKEKAEEAIEDIKRKTGKNDMHWLPLDLSDLAAVCDSAEQFKTQEKELHILINNAGVMATTLSFTKDGYETQWGTNVVGHFVFIKKLLPLLISTASLSPPGTVRVINLTSLGHRMAPRGGIDFSDTAMLHYWIPEWRRYGQSKLGNILLTKEIARRYASTGVICVAVHPGVIKTQLHTNVHQSWFVKFLLSFSKSSEISEDEGAYTSVFAATHPRVETEKMNGEFLIPFGEVSTPSCEARDSKLATKLWDFLERDIAGKVSI